MVFDSGSFSFLACGATSSLRISSKCFFIRGTFNQYNSPNSGKLLGENKKVYNTYLRTITKSFARQIGGNFQVRVTRTEPFSLYKMSVREKFLHDFKLLSHTLKENVSIYYVTDFGYASGITFFELSQLSDKLSLYFLEIFESSNPYIGIFLEDYFYLPCLILAAWKSGKTFCGIGKQYSKKDTLYYLNSLKVKYLITDANTNEYDGKVKSEFSIQDNKFYIWEREKLWKDVMTNNYLKEICYGIMTSGTTNEPKIIHVPWDCILPNAVELSEEFKISASDCIFLASPCSFDPFFIELFMMLLKGCSLVIVPDVVKLNSKKLHEILFLESSYNFDQTGVNSYSSEKDTVFQISIKRVKKPCITVLQMTPSVFKIWSDEVIKNCIFSCHSCLRVLVLGGEPFPKNILELKHPENKTKIFNIYGITEISCWAFLNEVTHLALNEEVSLGKPLNSIKYKISHDGELFLGSSSRICFIEGENNNKGFGGIIFRKTNDVVRLDDGKIYYLGRSNEIIKKYGIKVNLTKIEKSFKNIKIKECYCVFNEKCRKLGLFFLPVAKTSKVSFKPVSYEKFFKNFGPFTTETVSDIEKPDCFVEISEVPLNHHGKIDKKILREYLGDVQGFVASDTDLKNGFRNHWVEVLNLKISDFSSKNFIELGGNSLLALRLINKLSDLGFKIPQTLISQLLSKDCYDSCFESFKCAQKEDEKMKSVTTKKRKTFHVSVGGVKLIPRWKFGLGKCIDATPSVFTYEREERVAVGSHSSKLSCIHATTGREIWTVSLGGRIESGFRTNRGKTKGFIGCYDHFAYCIALLDGTFLWKFKTGDMIKSTPCLSTDEKILYVASYDTKLYCLSTETGEALHVLKLSDGGIYCSGIVSDWQNAFFIGTLSGTCVRVDQETNQIIWTICLQSPVFASPCLLESRNEIIFSEVLGIVHCLNASNGTEMWTFKASNNIYSSPVARQSCDVFHILFGCHDDHLYCLKYDKACELNWKCQLDSPIFGKPSILWKSSNVCVASTQGVIYVCDIDSGSIRSHLKLDGEVFSSVVHSNDRLFVGCRDDNIYCVDVT